MKMNPKHKIITISITILIVAIIIFAGFYYSSHFKIPFEITDDALRSWKLNYTIDGEMNEIALQAYITNGDEWNLLFYKWNYSTIDWNPDFTNYSYAFLYWGWFPTLSYSINFTRIFFNDGILEFHFSTLHPGVADFMVPRDPKQMVQFENSQLRNHAVKGYEFIWDSSDIHP